MLSNTTAGDGFSFSCDGSNDGVISLDGTTIIKFDETNDVSCVSPHSEERYRGKS